MMLQKSRIYKVSYKIQHSKISMGHLPVSNVYATLRNPYMKRQDL